MTSTEHLLWLIDHDPRLFQEEIAQAYAKYLRDESTDWPAVNRAIAARWSRAGLKRIKQMAWSEA